MRMRLCPAWLPPHRWPRCRQRAAPHVVQLTVPRAAWLIHFHMPSCLAAPAPPIRVTGKHIAAAVEVGGVDKIILAGLSMVWVGLGMHEWW